MAQILTSGFAGHTSSGTIALCLCHIKQFQTKLICTSVDVSHHALLTKTNIWNHWSNLPAFWKIFFLFLYMSMYEYTHIYMGSHGSQGHQLPQSWLQAMRAMLLGTGTKVWTSVKVTGVFNNEATLQPPYSCLSCLIPGQVHVTSSSHFLMQNRDEFVPTEFHS